MKKIAVSVLIIILSVSLAVSANAAGYTLPQRMMKQLQAGSGLIGSFVIHGNADHVRYPFLAAVQNAEYDIVGIKQDGYLHYHVFQTPDTDHISLPGEFLGLNGSYYFRSSFLDNRTYAFPDADQIINLLLDTSGDNPSVFSELLKVLLSGSIDDNNSIDTSALEKQVDLWISGFAPVTSIGKDEQSVPKLTQVFSIPVDSMYEKITGLIQYISQNDTAMSILRSSLSEEEIALYFNADLSYYYIESMKNLDLSGSIVYSRTVSTLGELLESTISLPLSESKTGYSTIVIHSDDRRKNFQISGKKGFVYIDLPADFRLSENEFTESVRLITINNENNAGRNLALQMEFSKKHEEHHNPEETTSFETDFYSIHAERDVTNLPESVTEDMIDEMDPVALEAELQYSSKSQVYSSPTTLEFAVGIQQGVYHYSVTGSVISASPNNVQTNYSWAVAPFNTEDAVQTDHYTLADFSGLISEWRNSAERMLIRTPEEIKPAE